VEPRIDVKHVSPQTYEPMLALERYVHSVGIEPRLMELMKLRASQINGCAYCVDMHARRLRELGEPNERVDAVAVWEEGPFFSERERAALAWTEAVTLLSEDHVPDDVYNLAASHFDEKELVNLTMLIVAINGWNRLAVAFRALPESYQRARQAAG
jgi:uncharacterized peroxidase-related enzyme